MFFLARKPEAKNSKPKVQKEDAFKITSSGKLVIPHDIDSGRSKKEILDSDSDEDDLDKIANQIEETSIGMKRKLSSRASSIYSEPASKYQGEIFF